MTLTETTAPDLMHVKRRQQQMWASGDFHAVATLIQPVADALCHAVDLQAGWRVLDVACGSGNAAIAAARYGCEVVGIDYVPALLARGRRRAEAEGVSVELLEGDAESIPFPDGSFDAVLSVYGSMFAPDPALSPSPQDGSRRSRSATQGAPEAPHFERGGRRRAQPIAACLLAPSPSPTKIGMPG
jgi:SAM-dependent methyltransferase